MAFHCVKTTFHFFHENVYLSHPALGHIVSAVERRISRKRFKFKLCIFFNRIALSPHMAKSTLYIYVTTFSLQLFAFFIFSSLLSIFHIFFPQLFSNTKLVLTRCICTFYFDIKTMLKAPVCFQTLVDGPQRLK